ncbi:uracil-DNA glycosylase [soil metagenome]
MPDAAARLWAHIPAPWKALLGDDVHHAPYFAPLAQFVEHERAAAEAGGPPIFPPEKQTFTALTLTPPSAVKVVILGQDPYFRAGQAQGLAFSVTETTRVPPSLRNAFKELMSDLGAPKPKTGSLLPWAARGVLLLNAVLTVREGIPGSHARKGWEKLTSELLRKLSLVHEGTSPSDGIVFVLWGAAAQSKRPLIERPGGEAGPHTHHAILEASHPSPRSVDVPAPIPFIGSKPYSKANHALLARGKAEIDWTLPS